VGQRDRLGVVHQVVELVNQYQNVHREPLFRQRLSRSFNAVATSLGTRSSLSPPKVASSFTPLELRKLYLADAIRYTDSISGACMRLSWLSSSSYSKSEIARSPLTIAIAPRSRANATSRMLNGSTTTLPSSR